MGEDASIELVTNGVASGDVGARLVEAGFDPNALRPYIDEHGKHCVTVRNAAGKYVKRELTSNAATLPYDAWKHFDNVIRRVAMPRLKAVSDLRSRGLEYIIPNGMGSTVLESQAMSDISDASITMDGVERTHRDRPVAAITHLPLPIIHKDFSFSLRQIEAAKRSAMPLDTTMIEMATRKCADSAEKLLLGTAATSIFAGGRVYGYTNTPHKIAATLTNPTTSGWVPDTIIDEVLAMVEASKAAFHFGGWVLYYGTGWGRYMNNEYKKESSDTLAQRLARTEGIEAVSGLDYLSGYDMLLVSMSSDTVREVVGMDFTAVQWDGMGGLEKNFKVMGIMVPQIRADYNGKCGIVHGRVSA